MNPITALLTALGALSVAFVGLWTSAVVAAPPLAPRAAPPRDPATDARLPHPVSGRASASSPISSTRSGIGSFATTTAIFRAFKMVPDRIIPGTLNVGHTLPTVVQAFIFTKLIPVDVLTLISMIAAAVLGAWLGAGVVARWPKRKVQIGMGVALLAAATFMFMKQMSLFPPGSEAIGVRGTSLAIAIGGNFLLGALMTLGIGLYAPCMILVGLLGMSEKTAFPIMMGSCAFLMPVGSLRFIREQSYSLRNAHRAGGRRRLRVLHRCQILREPGYPHRPLAGDRGRGLHRDHDAALGAVGANGSRDGAGEGVKIAASLTSALAAVLAAPAAGAVTGWRPPPQWTLVTTGVTARLRGLSAPSPRGHLGERNRRHRHSQRAMAAPPGRASRSRIPPRSTSATSTPSTSGRPTSSASATATRRASTRPRMPAGPGRFSSGTTTRARSTTRWPSATPAPGSPSAIRSTAG